MALVLGSVLAAGLAVPLEHALGGWPESLAFWALPALVAALVWLPAALRPGTTVARGGGAPLRRSGLAWAVSGFFGVQSMAFYASLSWIPSILEDGGWSSEAAGALLAFGALCGLVPAFLVPVLAARAENQLRLLLAIVLVPAAGLAGVLVAPGAAPLWMVLIGFGQSGALGLGARPPDPARRRRADRRVADGDGAVRRLPRRGDRAVAARRRARRLRRLDRAAGRCWSRSRSPSCSPACPRRARVRSRALMDTQVGIVGAGPAGLLLAHLLQRAGIESVVLEAQDPRVRRAPRARRRARAGHRRRAHGDRRRRPAAPRGDGPPRARAALRRPRATGSRSRSSRAAATITVYGQQEVVKDLIAARLDAGGELRFEAAATAIEGLDGERPVIRFGDGERAALRVVAGCDGFHGVSRAAVPVGRAHGLRARVSVRLARDPRPRGAVLAGADLHPPRPRLRAAQHALARGHPPLPPGRARRGRRRRGPTSASGRSCRPAWPPATAASRSTRARSSTRASRRCARSSPSRCATAGCSSPATRRTSCPPTGAKGLNLAVADVRVLARGAARVLRARRRVRPRRATRTAACDASGACSTSRGG